MLSAFGVQHTLSKAAMQPRTTTTDRPGKQQMKTTTKQPVKLGQGVLQAIQRPPQPRPVAKPASPAPQPAKPPMPTTTNKMGMGK